MNTQYMYDICGVHVCMTEALMCMCVWCVCGRLHKCLPYFCVCSHYDEIILSVAQMLIYSHMWEQRECFYTHRWKFDNISSTHRRSSHTVSTEDFHFICWNHSKSFSRIILLSCFCNYVVLETEFIQNSYEEILVTWTNKLTKLMLSSAFTNALLKSIAVSGNIV